MFGNKRTILMVLVMMLALFADVAQADYIVGTPTNIGFGTSPSDSNDGLSLYIDANPSYGGEGDADIWIYTREQVHDDWSGPVNLGPPINTWSLEGNPDISADGLTLFFDSDRPGGQGGRDLWYSTRETPDGDWSEPNNLGPTVNGLYYDGNSCVSRDGLTLYFTSDRPGGYGGRDIWFITRATIHDDWSEPENLGPLVNSPSDDYGPDISSDSLKLFFDSYRPGGYGERDIWLARRTAVDAPWKAPVNLGPIVNTSYRDITACISSDGSTLYFYSSRPGGYLRQASIDPVVDLNADGIVDSADMVIMYDNLGTDNSLCDIGPTPFGDGIVDVQDLIVLAEHFFEEVGDANAADFITVDDFESYNEIWPPEEGSNLIFMTWADGYDVPENGSTIGSSDVLIETTIVHEGSQSAPLHYDNTVAAYSEVTAYVANQQPAWPPNTLSIGPDWTEEGVEVLSLWFRGKATNDAETMYVALNGVVIYHDNANATQVTNWQEWQIPLQQFADKGVDLKNVTSISIGFRTPGSTTASGSKGEMFIDDITLLRPAAAPVTLIEDFDSLAVGTNMHDVDGWEGWYGDSSKGARVTDAVAYSGTNSLEIVGNRDDLVRNWPKLTTGKWVLSVMQYCPSDKQTTGIVYFGILTEYDGVAGTKAWIGELRANFAAGKAYYSWNSTIQVDLVYDEWVELRLEVDLDAQVADFYYNNVFLATAASPVPSLVGVNIFPEPSIEAVYFDDLRIEAVQ